MSESPGASERLLRRIEWTSLRRLDGLLQGDYRTLLRGAGLDLADLREYQYQDDVRRIDWNATARLDVPQVRDFLEDRELAAWFVLDLSASVDFGSGAISKRDLCAGFTGLLGRVLLRHGNRVGAVCAGGDGACTVLPARGGRTHLLHLLSRIAAKGSGTGAGAGATPAPGPGPGPAPAPGGLTDLGAMLTRAAGLIRRRSLVLVVSDFISTPGWEQALARLSMRHEVIAVRLLDPLEECLPDLGLVPLRDSETGDWLMVDTGDRGVRARYEALAQAADERLQAALARAGVDALELRCDEDVAQALFGFLQLRKQRARLSAGAASAAMAALAAGRGV
ncbi:MAG: DUF58 domain-containing protein [Burkholderiales bacterium]|nr:DUF58 domain-containing protein [Burkholderiales bacterium]